MVGPGGGGRQIGSEAAVHNLPELITIVAPTASLLLPYYRRLVRIGSRPTRPQGLCSIIPSLCSRW